MRMVQAPSGSAAMIANLRRRTIGGIGGVAMKSGYFLSFPRWDEAESWRQVYRDAVEQVELAEELGFDYLWFPEHHFQAGLNAPAPLLNCVDAAARTKRIRVGAAVILSPYHHPLILAEA